MSGAQRPSGAECARCGQNSPCVDWNEVDIGVGIQTFDHEYACPTHGCFAFVWDEEVGKGRIIWRNEGPTAPTTLEPTT